MLMIEHRCTSCNGWALSFDDLVNKCNEAKFFDEYMPSKERFKHDICFECYEGEVEGMALSVYEYEHDV
jgi:hypothetical protein